MEKHIIAFDNEIKELHKLNPDDPTLNAIKKYKESKNKKSYYSALDSFGFDLGVGMMFIPCSNKKEDFAGLIPALRFYKNNKLNVPPQDLYLFDQPEKSLSKCCSYIAKELVYKLMQIPEIEKYI